MMKFDLKLLSMQDLKSLQNKVEREMAGRDKRLRKDALTALKERAKQLGYSLDDLVGQTDAAMLTGSGSKLKSRAPAAPKYRNKQDPTQTWSGRGRPPQWFREAKDNGDDVETMRIND
jgi:DNA-binding protein H-NS